MTLSEIDRELREIVNRPQVCICGREVLEGHARIDDAEGGSWHLPCALLALVETRKALAEMLAAEERGWASDT